MRNTSEHLYDVIVVGAGAAGIMAAITAARRGYRVLLLAKLSKIAAKLKATG
ncbi:MAG: NAD(P)/FAD-dependent oxidoreductase, partial [Sulfuricurvum sp.]|nr:NAD(P)/FAD-dependent oxidoreductase [Sulfuricurvum sp.]